MGGGPVAQEEGGGGPAPYGCHTQAGHMTMSSGRERGRRAAGGYATAVWLCAVELWCVGSSYLLCHVRRPVVRPPAPRIGRRAVAARAVSRLQEVLQRHLRVATAGPGRGVLHGEVRGQATDGEGRVGLGVGAAVHEHGWRPAHHAGHQGALARLGLLVHEQLRARRQAWNRCGTREA